MMETGKDKDTKTEQRLSRGVFAYGKQAKQTGCGLRCLDPFLFAYPVGAKAADRVV